MIDRARTWSLVVSAALVLSALAAPAAAERGTPGPDRPVGGAAAVAALGARLPEMARSHRMTAAELEELLLSDPSTRVGRSGRLHVVDAFDAGTQAAPTTAAASYPLDQTFALHSLPGASKVIHLDFDGHVVSGTWWHQDTGLENRFYPGLDLDGLPGFSAAELAVVQSTWQRVAEDYAPFGVDVTTQDPGAAALDRAGSSDQAYGVRALFTSDQHAPQALCGGGCSGIAYVGTFDYAEAGASEPAWIFASPSYGATTLAGIASHEIGHNLGLHHDGKGTSTYYAGQGVWAPIMGQGLRTLSQFSNGDYASPTNTQDDFAVAVEHGLPLRPDDHADAPASGTVVPDGTPVPGLVGSRDDVDWFRFGQGCSGPVTVTALPADVGANLDLRLTVHDSAGTLVAGVDPLAALSGGILQGLGATWTATRPAGSYTVSVDGVGQGDPQLSGYSDYGSVGRYTLSVQAPCHVGTTTVASPPTQVAARVASRTALTISWAPPANTGGSPVTGYAVTGNGAQWSTPSLQRTFEGLTPGQTYTFSVLAITAAGRGAAATVTARLPALATAPMPRLLDATRAALSFAWSPPADLGGRPLQGYQVRLDAGPWIAVGTATRRTFTGLAAGSRHVFAVRALTSEGLGAVGSLGASTDPPARPSAPRIAPAASGVPGGRVTALARWLAPVSNGGAPITSYRIRALRLNRSGAVVGQYRVTVDDLLRRRWLVLPPGRYRFRVAAVNRAGVSAESSRSHVVVAR